MKLSILILAVLIIISGLGTVNAISPFTEIENLEGEVLAAINDVVSALMGEESARISSDNLLNATIILEQTEQNSIQVNVTSLDGRVGINELNILDLQTLASLFNATQILEIAEQDVIQANFTSLESRTTELENSAIIFSKFNSTFTMPDHSHNHFTKSCPEGTSLISGSYSNTHLPFVIIHSEPIDDRTYDVGINNNNGTFNFKIFIVCASN